MKRRMEVFEGRLFVQIRSGKYSAFHGIVEGGIRHFLGYEAEDYFLGKVPKKYRKMAARIAAGRVRSLPL